MFKYLTIKILTVFVLLFIFNTMFNSEIFLGVREGIINFFNFSSINFNLLKYLSLAEDDHTFLKDLRIK